MVVPVPNKVPKLLYQLKVPVPVAVSPVDIPLHKNVAPAEIVGAGGGGGD